MISLEEYIKQLNSHDWFYYFSDDHGVWQRGEGEHHRLLHIAQSGSNEFKKAYNDACAKRFNNPSFVPAGKTYVPPFKLA
jgi:hypothetical protein